MVGYLATLFLGRPPRGSLPVLSTHSFDSNWQLALLALARGGNYFFTKECAERMDRSWDHCLQVDTLPNELPRLVTKRVLME